MTRDSLSRKETSTVKQKENTDMCVKEETRKRLERCKTCTKPQEGEGGKCPGCQGLGCIGDWRCCNEIDAVCKNCTEHGESCYLYCDKINCEKMQKYKTE